MIRGAAIDRSAVLRSLVVIGIASVLLAAHLATVATPLALPTPLVALDALFALGLLTALLLVATALGLRLLRWVHLSEAEDPSALLFSAGLGLGVVAYVVLAVGLAGLLYWWLFVALGVAAVVLARRELAQVCRVVQRIRPPERWHPFEVACAVIVVAFLALGFLATLGPLVDYDAQMYHLAAPELYVRWHRIAWLSENTHANFPANVEMLYTLGLLFGSDQFAKMLNFAFEALTALGLYQLVGSRYGRLAALLSALIFVSIPIVANTAGKAGVDQGLTFFALLAVWAFLTWLGHRRLAWAALSGLFAGLAAGIKYTGLQFLVALVIVYGMVLLLSRVRSAREWVLTLGVPALAAAAVAGPWYLKNWLVFGNPVYPVYFGGVGWTARRLGLFQSSFAGFGFGHSLAGYLSLLPNMLLYPTRFTLDPPGLVSAFLLLVPFAWLARRRDPVVWALLALCALQFAFWSAGMQESRFLMPILPWLAVLAAVVVERVARVRRRSVAAAIPVLSILAVLPLLVVQLQQANVAGVRVLLGLESRQDYLVARFDEYPAIEYVNDKLPATARVLLLWRNRGYYLQRPYLPDDFYDRFDTLYEAEGSLPGVYARLRSMGITHLLVNGVDLPHWQADPNSPFHEDVRLYQEFRRTYLVPIGRFGSDELLALRGG